MFLWVRVTGLLLSIGLLGVSLIGVLHTPRQAVPKPLPTSEPSIPGYHTQLRDGSDLRALLTRPTDDFEIAAVNRVVFESIAHSNNRRLSVFENWLLWVGGFVYEPLGKTQNPHRIAEGEQGLCSEVSMVVNHIADLNGVPSRLVGLSGHVVSELKQDDGWHVADADYGVTFAMSVAELEQPENRGVMVEAILAAGHSQTRAEEYAEAFLSADDNVVYPVGSAGSPRLAQLEMFAEWLKWLLPLAGLIFFSRKWVR